jgi:PAS domain S-box-containing protein
MVDTPIQDRDSDSSNFVERADVSDLDTVSCADEPIRVPGSIQPHGFLLGVNVDKNTVAFASANAEMFLKLPPKLIIGSPLELVLPKELMASIRGIRGAVDPPGLVTYLGAFHLGDELCSVLTHCVNGRRIFEFERQDRLVGAEMTNVVMTNFVASLAKLRSEGEVCDAITKQISDLTGFDRVLLYSFDDAGHGTVLSETNNGVLPSYLDLRFPATDIPAQARALYVENTVRIIPDAQYDPIPLLGFAGEGNKSLDMSLCVLRSVSPVHLEYMRNMGTRASMSVSIVCEDKLWGLVSCHHSKPGLVPFLVRSACDLLSKMVGTQLTSFLTASKLTTLLKFHVVQRQMMTLIAAETDYLAALVAQLPSLVKITDADSVVLFLDGDIHSLGPVPPKSAIRELVTWLNTRESMAIYASNFLSSELAWAKDLTATASGVLAIRISDIRQRYVLWFRPETIRTVKWAGEPINGVDQEKRLHPRKSFASWQEILRGQSQPWSPAELESARELLAALNTISLRRAEEEAELNAARFNKLTHTLPIKIFAATDDGYLTYVNARWEEEGLSSEGLWFGAGRLVAEDSERCAVRWAQAVANEEDFEEEVRFIRQNERLGTAKELWNLVHVVPFRRKGAGRAGWIGASIDLTERKQRETALRVTDKLAFTSRMTSFFAHEINNPLEAVTNLLYLLKSRAQDDPESLGYFGLLDNEFERISGVVKQTLRWTSETSDKQSWATAGELFDDVLRLFSAKIKNRNVTVRCNDPQAVRIFGIVSQLRQAIAHLLSNAIDAVPLGGEIRMEAYVRGELVYIEVTDNGSGMTTAQQEFLFQPFFSTKGDLGNGLGLYITREIIDRHQGAVEIHSSHGKGTTVRVKLAHAGQD